VCGANIGYDSEWGSRAFVLRASSRVIVISSIGATDSPQSLSVTLRGSSYSSLSCSGSIDLWHIEHFAMHAAQRSRADRRIL
jgi:hypothetical protein